MHNTRHGWETSRDHTDDTLRLVCYDIDTHDTVRTFILNDDGTIDRVDTVTDAHGVVSEVRTRISIVEQEDR